MIKSTTEVGPALFFALLIITVSFIPVFVLGQQVVCALAFTKTYASSSCAGNYFVPVLAGYFVRGKYDLSPEPGNRVLERVSTIADAVA